VQPNPAKILKTCGPAQLPVRRGDVVHAAKNTILKGDLTPGALRFIRMMENRYIKELGRLARAETNADRHGPLFMVEHSFAARFCGIVLTRRKHEKNIALARVLKLAAEVRTRTPTDEPVKANTHHKPDGGTRTIANFGWRDRAARRITKDILSIVMGESPYEHARKGRGRETATQKLLTALNQGGVKRLVVGDLAGCYPSVSQKWLYDVMPLPKAIIRNCVLINDEKTIRGTTYSVFAVQEGIPQGSPSSSLVVGHIMKQILDGAGPVACKLSYGDDFTVGVTTDDQVEAAKSALAQQVAGHPAGPLKLKHLTVIQPGEPNNFLGYMYRHSNPIFGPDRIRVSASPKAILRFQRKAAIRLLLVPDKVGALEAMTTNWARSFRSWPGRETGAAVALAAAMFDVIPVVRDFERRFKKLFPQVTNLEAIREVVIQTGLQYVGPGSVGNIKPGGAY
jgi:hypothetical protein